MYATDSRPTRILAQPGIDYLEALEQEIGRRIIITNGGTNAVGRAHERAQRARILHPDVDNPVVVVLGSTIENTEWCWWYMSRFHQDFLVDPAAPDYFPSGEFLSFDPNQYEGLHGFSMPMADGSGDRIYAEADTNLVVLGMRLQATSDYEASYENLNWDRLLGDPIRLAASDDLVARAEQLRVERRRRAFDAFVANGRDRLLRQVRSQIEQTEATINDYQSGLAQALSDLNMYSKQVTSLEATLDADGGTWQRRFDELCSHSKLADVQFVGESFVLTTDHLRMTSPDTGDSRWLGRFRITIPVGRSDGYSIRFQNLDNPKGGRAHPHIDTGGGPCFGAISATVAQLHADMELMALADVLLMFLESFNPKDDWGGYAAWWFGVDDEDPRPEFNSNAAVEEPEAVVA